MKKVLLVYLLVCFTGLTNAQSINAGQHNTNDYYYKFTPDSNVINMPGHDSSNSTKYYSLDINNDGTMDFQLGLFSPTTALGFQLYYCTISGLNNNNVASANYDSCYNFGNGYVKRYGMANAFSVNDTIDSNANWVNSVYLNYDDQFGMPPDSQFYSCGSPNWSDTAYLGVRINVNSSFEYGWIKIVEINYEIWGITTLTMGTFACENGVGGIKEIKNYGMQLSIYPNPATNNLTIEAPPLSTIKISNIEGHLMKTIAASGAKTNVDVSSLSCGVYIVEVITEKDVGVKKFVKE